MAIAFQNLATAGVSLTPRAARSVARPWINAACSRFGRRCFHCARIPTTSSSKTRLGVSLSPLPFWCSVGDVANGCGQRTKVTAVRAQVRAQLLHHAHRLKRRKTAQHERVLQRAADLEDPLRRGPRHSTSDCLQMNPWLRLQGRLLLAAPRRARPWLWREQFPLPQQNQPKPPLGPCSQSITAWNHRTMRQ